MKLPFFLKLLYISSLAGASLRIISIISIFIFPNLSNFWLYIPGFTFIEIYPDIFFNILLIISSALSFWGILMMWQHKILGFYIYLTAQWGLILFRLFFNNPIFLTLTDELPNILISIVFSISYAFYIPYFKKINTKIEIEKN
jgi:hypothetical protein